MDTLNYIDLSILALQAFCAYLAWNRRGEGATFSRQPLSLIIVDVVKHHESNGIDDSDAD